jgi:hypothetical protein
LLKKPEPLNIVRAFFIESVSDAFKICFLWLTKWSLMIFEKVYEGFKGDHLMVLLDGLNGSVLT